NVQRATIVEFLNPQNYQEFLIRREYKCLPEIQGLKNVNYKKQAAAYWARKTLDEGVHIVIDNISESNTPLYFKSSYKALGVKSIIGFPIKRQKDIWGTFVLSEYNYYRHWTDDEINLLETISNQVYSAIKQAELFTATKKYAEREALLRKIVETIRSSLDINETLTIICDEVAKLFNVERATIVEFPNSQNYKEYNIRREYKLIPEIKGLLNIEYERNAAAYWGEKLLRENADLIIDNIELSNTPDYFKSTYKALGVKSIFGFPIRKGEEAWGTFVLSAYNCYRHWTDEEITLLETIASQVYIAIKQAELYTKTKKQAERERALYQSVNVIRSTLNINKIKQTFIIEAAKLFQADRSFIVEYDSVNEKLLSINKNLEYLASPDVKSFTTLNVRYLTYWFKKIIIEKKEIIMLDDQEYLKEYNLEKTLISKFLKDYSIKSSIIVPILHADQIFGVLVIQHTKKKVSYRNEDTEFIRTLASQVGVAFYQSQLYSSIETSEKYTKFILNGIKDGVIALNEEYLIESCNQEVENIFEYPVSEIKGKSISVLMPQLIINNGKLVFAKEKQRVISPNVSDLELIGLKKSGSNFSLEIGVNKILFEKKLKFIFLIRDITERKKIEQMKNEFISTVSHELRTPLTSIQGSLELVLSTSFGDIPDQIRNLVGITYKNCIRLSNLINDLLDIEKIEIGKMQFRLETMELIPVIKEAIEANKSYAEKFNVKFIFKPNNDNIKVNVDKNRLIQVITNLLSNAVKFSPPGDIVTIYMSRENDFSRISISDNGSGIPEGFKSKIFQKFSQSDSSNTRQKGGTGLGLSISKAIIEKMGGSISYISEENKGSTFYFDIPVLKK
ncbi:MAG: GAF domain-containing protein, partial [Candidatus Gastranaerophilales bacterium]|nr:GAF domain-containing protein [Candidatus Gastranaerophilales bacterium]